MVCTAAAAVENWPLVHCHGFGIALGDLLGYGIGHIRGALSSWKYEVLNNQCYMLLLGYYPDDPKV